MRLHFEDCVLDLATRELRRKDRIVPLSPKAFALLELLALQRPKAVSKAEIHKALWPDTFVSETNLANLVVELRGALDDDAHAPRIIRTVPRFGYAFSAEGRSEDDAAPGAAPAVSDPPRLVWGRRVIDLGAGENLIGRDRSAAVWINDESVSRRHARILVGDDGNFLEDLGSKNGTFLRGVPVRSAVRLEDGDEFTVGELVTPLRFHILASSVSTRTGTRAGRRSRVTP
ncbi:MAG TPA: FHA domain-containing protein [Thermoanaerobaculia bacterium]|jgi:DNA-binding winged helix-turn-helix (wHTH) protein|nr:FHA domain-containing protein [Thermoanaerobaculia bacterium]